MAVVVATHDRAPLLSRLLRSLQQQVGPPSFEVVIVDDGSTDGTWDEIERLEAEATVSVRGVRMSRQSGPAAARNAGWRASNAPIVLFTDDDCVPQPRWLSTLAAALREVDIAQGTTAPDPDQRQLLGPFARTMEVRSETGYYQTCNVGYRRATLERVGGFDDELRQAGEDIELATRARAAGATTAFCADAVVHHDVRPSSLRAQLRGTRRWAGIALAVRKQPILRDRLHYGFLWKRTHAPVIAAVAGLVTMATASGPRRLLGMPLLVPYVRHRLVIEPLPHTTERERVRLLPAAFAADATEVAVLAAASVRHRTLVL